MRGRHISQPATAPLFTSHEAAAMLDRLLAEAEAEGAEPAPEPVAPPVAATKPEPAPAPARRRGRPKGSKNKVQRPKPAPEPAAKRRRQPKARRFLTAKRRNLYAKVELYLSDEAFDALASGYHRLTITTHFDRTVWQRRELIRMVTFCRAYSDDVLQARVTGIEIDGDSYRIGFVPLRKGVAS